MLATIYSKTVKERTLGLLISVLSVSAMVALAVWVYSDLDEVIAITERARTSRRPTGL